MMEAKEKIKLQSLEPYRHLFPQPPGINDTVKKGATVLDTVNIIPEVVRQYSWQVEKYVNQELRGLSTYDACKKLWNFVKYHIKYERDEPGLEQIRTPSRLIADGKGDCDCFTTFIDCCLYTLKIPYLNRITKYWKEYFQHIYPLVSTAGHGMFVVPTENGGYITMDCVVGSFNYEEPYSEKKDYPMDLQILNGINDDANKPLIGIDAQDLFGDLDEYSDLGKLLKKKTPQQKAAKKEKRKERRKNFGKKALKVVNKVNKVNPATVLLRAGILASMKTNVMKVAEKLKWAYATPQYAASKGMDMVKYAKLKTVLAKTEKIFYGAGGSPENLKKAILTGRGNRNHDVAGLDGDNNTDLPTLLGAIYDDEFINGMDGTLGLGELGVVTATAVAAASGAMGTLAALLKSIGDLFPRNRAKAAEADNSGGDGGNDNGGNPSATTDDGPPLLVPEGHTDPATDFEREPDPVEEEPSEDPAPSNEDNNDKSKDDGTDNLPAPTDDNTEVTTSNPDSGDNSDNALPATQDDSTNGVLSGLGAGFMAYYQKNKKWLLPVGVVGVVGLTVGAVVVYKKYYSGDNAPKPRSRSLNGPGKRKSTKKKGGKTNRAHNQKTMIALM